MEIKQLLINETDIDQIEQVATALQEISAGSNYPQFIGLAADNLKHVVKNIKTLNQPPLATKIIEKLAIHRVGGSDPLSILTQECCVCGTKVNPGEPLYMTIEENNTERSIKLYCEKCALELRVKNE